MDMDHIMYLSSTVYCTGLFLVRLLFSKLCTRGWVGGAAESEPRIRIESEEAHGNQGRVDDSCLGNADAGVLLLLGT